mmetsp:Transcript_2073/g.3162  ORF Transcript_2073/g.3162 Transcript_2073/m.3162 type:complete len:512 (+) Transcript_2073:39-1574(+)|eukprot:CAMPEP_0184349236 /NCGR_PEP_ID=MMETSP1089-20130417/32262_1 /TAXON_ID=38269 ORGANISM="Gloeochaete wittrockiana, Strain SAG46.84" /NCGR_SAMPLE_ID=MMETSP1089 /ASSEMBLY_ACC=CAM_ASM_000445 /LENGTH=511 /DNA_ID=CAMNT_0026681351 /DNA_START=57 /DNA_END=1592 /DNA_ORIENTATION=-
MLRDEAGLSPEETIDAKSEEAVALHQRRHSDQPLIDIQPPEQIDASHSPGTSEPDSTPRAPLLVSGAEPSVPHLNNAAVEKRRKIFNALLFIAGSLFIAVFVVLGAIRDWRSLISFLGLCVFSFSAFAFSSDRKSIKWRPVVWGLFLQFFFGVIILRTWLGYHAFDLLGQAVSGFLDNSDYGSEYVFGKDFRTFFFALKVLPTLVFFAAFISVLYHLQVLQRVVGVLAYAMQAALGISGSEAFFLCFVHLVGSSEASLFIKPYLSTLTNSEMACVMTGGFATISGSLLVVYIQLGVPASHLLAASLMSTPAALALSKMVWPETEESVTKGTVALKVDSKSVNLWDAAAEGATEGLKLIFHIASMLIAFLSILAAVNAALNGVGSLFGHNDITVELIFSYVLRPVAFLMGVPWEDCGIVAELLGRRMILNEFIAYLSLKDYMSKNLIGERAITISTYALCGFANLGSVGVTLGCFGGLAPERRGDAAKLGFRTMLLASMALCMTASVAGILV